MDSQKFTLIINGIPCLLIGNEVNEFAAKCSSQGYSLEKLIQIGKTLFKSDPENCYKFLEYVERNEMSRNIYKDFVHQPYRIQIYYSLAALSLGKALKQNDKQNSQKWQKEFNRCLNLGSKSSGEKLYQLLHGFNSYYAGDFTKAIANFNSLDQKDNQLSTIALLGLAQSYFMFRKYETALQYYKKALISNKNLPTKARLGMAYCFFELQKYQLAQKCFQRILYLDPTCAQAYLGLAVICYRNNDNHGYFINLKQAYRLKPNDPLVILHLSEHFLILGEHQKCKKMSTKGLQVIQTMPKFMKKDILHRDDYQIFKARFNNLIGQVHHTENQFEQARKYYQLANNRGLRYNSIALAQTMIQANLIKQALKILEHFFTTSKTTQLRLIADFYKTIAYLQVKAQVKPASQDQSPNYYYKQALKYNKYDYDTLIDYAAFLSEMNDKNQTLKTLQNALKILENNDKQPKPQLLNNIGVFLIEQKYFEEAIRTLQRANYILEESPKESAEQQLRYHALYLTINFNLAVAYEFEHCFSDAIQIHENLLNFNKYYVDSYVRLADILHQLGEKQKALSLLQNAITECTKIKQNQIRLDKLLVMKAHLYHMDGSNTDAKQCFKKLGNFKFQYEQFYEMCLGYENVIKKQYDKTILKDFLRPNREACIQICGGDPYNVHGFMVLIILFLTDNRITKQQAVQYFNQLKIAQQQFPDILYNYGIFSMLNEDYENALFCLNRYQQKTKTTKADEYIALVHLLKGDYQQCLNSIKKNILNQPNNLKFRYQYAYVKQKRVQKLFEEEKNLKDLKSSTIYLSICKKTYETLGKISPNDYIRTQSTPDMKEKLRAEVSKLRETCDYRDRFVQSQFGYYLKREKQIQEKEKKIKQDQAYKLQEIKRAKENKRILDQMGEDEDQSDSQKRRKERRKRLAQLSLQENQRANEQWKLVQEQEKLNEAEDGGKRKRRNNENKKPRRERRQVQKQQQQQNYPSEQEFKEEGGEQEDDSFGYDENEEPQRERESKKKKKKKKNKNRDRDGSDDEKSKKKKKKKRERKQGDEQVKNEEMDQQKSALKEQQRGDSEQESNPFEDDSEEKSKSDQEMREREKPQKKRKKNLDDQDEIDIGNFIIQ